MRADFGYGPGNLLGAVSQSGGTPTGAVIERGASADGEYVRFADGTQICTTSPAGVGCIGNAGALFASATQTWTYPVPFVSGSTPAVSGSGGATGRFLSLGAATDSQADWQVLSTISDTTAIAPALVAIGRWI